MQVPTWQRVRIWAVGATIGIFLLNAAPNAGSQQRNPNNNPNPNIDMRQPQLPGEPSSRPGATDPLNSMTAKMGDQQARSRNADRQKRLEVDTEKLLALATELKEQVDKTDKNVLSLDVIKKADEIERLAKSVKERMKG